MKGDCYKSILLALIGIFQFASSFAASDSLLIIQNVSVVDVGTKCIHKNVDIVIEGRIIKRILPFNPDNKYHNAQIINSSGDYCIPGLIDSHVHLDTEPVES